MEVLQVIRDPILLSLKKVEHIDVTQIAQGLPS